MVASFTRTPDTIITTTWDYRVHEWTDNIFLDRPLLKELVKRKKSVGGGLRCEVPVKYKKTTSAKFLASDMETLTPDEKDFAAYATYEWVQYADSLAISEASRHKNAGDARFFDYANEQIDNILESNEETLHQALWKASPSSVEVNSITAMVNTAGTGTVGTIVSGTDTWWKNKFKSSVGSFATSGRQAITEVYNDCCRGMNTKAPDWIVTDQTGFEAAEYYLAVRERLTPSANQSAGIGYESIKFKKAEIVWDYYADTANGGPIASSTGDGRFYLVNSAMWALYVLDGQWMTKGPWLEAYDQMGNACKIYSMFQVGMSGRRHFGVVSGVSYP